VKHKKLLAACPQSCALKAGQGSIGAMAAEEGTFQKRLFKISETRALEQSHVRVNTASASERRLKVKRAR
jgi:hypothetical protein